MRFSRELSISQRQSQELPFPHYVFTWAHNLRHLDLDFALDTSKNSTTDQLFPTISASGMQLSSRSFSFSSGSCSFLVTVHVSSSCMTSRSSIFPQHHWHFVVPTPCFDIRYATLRKLNQTAAHILASQTYPLQTQSSLQGSISNSTIDHHRLHFDTDILLSSDSGATKTAGRWLLFLSSTARLILSGL